MLLIIQLILYCLLFFLMVKAAVKDNGMNCLYFYPPAFIDEAARRGLADRDETMKRGKRFMVPFCIIMLVVLFYRQGMFGMRELPDILRGKRGRRAGKGAVK